MFDVSSCCLTLTFVSLVSVILSVIGRLPQLFFSWFHMHFHAQTGDNASTVSKAISGVSSLGSGVRWGPMGSDGVARRQSDIGQPQLCPDFLHLSSHSEGITIAIIASDCYWIYWILGILTCPKAVYWAQSEKQEYLRCIVRHCNQVDLTPIWCQKWRSDDDHCKYAKFLAHVGQLLANCWPFDQT